MQGVERVFVAGESFHPERIHAVALYCSDGRYGEQFDEFLHHGLGLPRYDRLAIPGGSGCLAGHFASYRLEDATLDEIRFLVESHALDRVVLIAHEACGYYTRLLHTPLSELRRTQEQDLRRVAERVMGQFASLHVDAYYASLESGGQDRQVAFDRVM